MTEKPLGLMRHLCEPLSPGAGVLDPFAGSGTTGIAAKTVGCSFIGVEGSMHYAEVAARRIAQDVLDFGDVS